MSYRIRLGVVAALSAALLGALAVSAQQDLPYGREERNDMVAAQQVQDPAGKVQAYESFIQKYPDSVLRIYIYKDLINVLFTTAQYPKVLSTVDGYIQFLKTVDRGAMEKLNIAEVTLTSEIYPQHYTYSRTIIAMLSSGQEITGEIRQGAAAHAREGLSKLGQVGQAAKSAQGADVAAIDKQLGEHELLYHQVLATMSWRAKDYDGVLPELGYLVEKTPEDANLNFQIGFSHLNKSTPDALKGIWYLARAVALNHPQADSARKSVVRQMVRRIGVGPSCMEEDINAIIQQAGGSLHPPAGWTLIDNSQINAARQGITYVGLFTDLAEGGDKAHITWLAACGLPFGLGEEGEPTYEAVLLEVEDTSANSESGGDNSTTGEGAEGITVILKVAATQEALKSKTANLEIVIDGFTKLEALKKKVDETIRIGGTIAQFRLDPRFMIRLNEGKVDLSEIE